MKATTLQVDFPDGRLFWQHGTEMEIKSKEVLTARIVLLLSEYPRASIVESHEEKIEHGYKRHVRVITVTTNAGSYRDHAGEVSKKE